MSGKVFPQGMHKHVKYQGSRFSSSTVMAYAKDQLKMYK